MDYKKYGWRRYAFYAMCVSAFVALALSFRTEEFVWAGVFWVLTGVFYLLSPKGLLADIDAKEEQRNAYRGR